MNVFDIQRFSVQDGPGIRTTVFFKGCPLNCLWCSNPESQNPIPELLYFETRCTHCYQCINACPSGAIIKVEDSRLSIDRKRCIGCGACVKECLFDARSISGMEMTVDEVFHIIEKDASYYRNSDGGVTVSGGEPTCQPESLIELLIKCREIGIHTCLDTCGFATWDILKKVIKYVDLLLMDNKHMDSATHRKLTGVGNELILENTAKVAEQGLPVIIRVPLIPGLNDSDENIDQLGKFMKTHALPRVDLLPYHRFSLSKYQALGKVYRLGDLESPNADEVRRVANTLESHGRVVAIV
jgi:glycyl-radical enzyme activating protein